MKSIYKDSKGSVLPIIALAVVLVIVVAGFMVFRSDKKDTNTSQSTNTSSEQSAERVKSETEKKFETYVGEDYDRYFMANMIAHHQGAIDMAKLTQTKAQHSELKTMANDIITAQEKEMNDMLAWQKAWGYPSSTGEMMEDHSAMGMMGEMDTMMTELEGLSGDAFDKRFLELMIEHHESAVDMARPGAKNAQHQEIKELAKAIIDAQTSEVAQMREWQVEWGYES